MRPSWATRTGALHTGAGRGKRWSKAAERQDDDQADNIEGATLVLCLDCTAPAVLRGRCERHHDAYERRASVRARRARRSVLARVHSGAARLRALVGARGGARCARCGSLALAGSVDVDHVQPLALGGEDTDQNVQPLCRDCHRVKTATEFSR
ncbi:HNH endonuclease [Streptomyces sp. NPDC012600]|uniref:HNH endonuclease signature motif containing protein n=1 Tax=Streptomyces stephensoniae TaxID=3375367 RepID=A0ABU2W951_9ACTN|nr:HNH endonuclease signature motif containing protein [Streptomyces griseus]MDT0494008.1 HNH endonuclease signature motif containing protein [Streptomyces griseus]